MEFDNIIPIGDHCVIAQVLRELNIRKKAYPFDWNCYKDMTDTSIRINFDIIDEITKNSIDDISRITKNMLNNTNIIFPHDNTSDENIISKYIKRMERLYNDITNGSKILYIMCTRYILISEEEILRFLEIISKYNSNSKILFITGIISKSLSRAK